jgi:hypothetical protein
MEVMKPSKGSYGSFVCGSFGSSLVSPYKHKGVFLAQLPYTTSNQNQTSTTLNDHIMTMCGILSTINMLRSMLIANFVHPTSSSSQYLQLAHVSLTRTVYNGIYNLDLNSPPLCLLQRHVSTKGQGITTYLKQPYF